MSELPIKRRTRRAIVRAQARLDAGAGDRFIPLIVAVALSVSLATLSLGRLRSLDTGNDLAGYAQAVWLLGQSLRPEATLFGDNVHLLELHFSFVLYPLAGLARLVPAATSLIFIQSVAIGVGVFPLWKLARKVADLRVGASSALIVAYALHPSIHQLGINDFHPESLAIPGLIGLAYFGATKRWIWYWASVAFVLSCRADLGLAVALWGFLLLSEGERRAGLWTLGVGTLWSLGLLLVVQPIFSEATAGQYGDYGDSLGEVFLTIATGPLDFLQDLTSSENVGLVVGLLAPVIFFPLLSLKHLLPAVPLTALYLVTGIGDSGAIAERSALLLAFVFIATAHALSRLGTRGVDRVFLDTRLLATFVAAAALFFITASPTSPHAEPWRWSDQDNADRAVVTATELLQTEDAVRASPSAIGHLAERPWLYTLDTSQQPQVAFAVFRVRAVLIDERDLPELTPEDRLVQRETFAVGMAQQGFEIRFADTENGVWLFFRP